MEYIILRSDFEVLAVSEDQVGNLKAEGSMLDLPCGSKWPLKILTDVGNGTPFWQYDIEFQDDRMIRTIYMQERSNLTLSIFNG